MTIAGRKTSPEPSASTNWEPPANSKLLEKLVHDVSAVFVQRHASQPEVLAAAPGRVNLIGEHIDYNDGFVLPMAIDRYVVVAASPNNSTPRRARLFSCQHNECLEISLESPIHPDQRGWGTYLAGVLAGFQKLNLSIPSFDAVVDANLPIGAGLSSSAALEVAMATTLETITQHPLSKLQKAILCQHAEHEFAGVPCGIMDQFSSVFGQQDHLMLIDCCSQTIRQVPMNGNEVSLLICNSNVKHELSGGEYAARRATCDSALEKLGSQSWRDLTMEQLHAASDELNESESACSRHVISEIQRTIDAAEAIEAGDWQRVGELMYQSHRSLRDDFKVSCDELDQLVEIAAGMGIHQGVLGSRMTGGGFGGSTVTLVKRGNEESVANHLQQMYKSATGIEADCFSSRPARGAHVLK